MKPFRLKDKIFEQLPESGCLSNAIRQLMRKHFMHCSPDYQMFLFLFQEFQEKKDPPEIPEIKTETSDNQGCSA